MTTEHVKKLYERIVKNFNKDLAALHQMAPQMIPYFTWEYDAVTGIRVIKVTDIVEGNSTNKKDLIDKTIQAGEMPPVEVMPIGGPSV